MTTFEPSAVFCNSIAAYMGFNSLSQRNDELGSAACDGLFAAQRDTLLGIYQTKEQAELAFCASFVEHFVYSIDHYSKKGA